MNPRLGSAARLTAVIAVGAGLVVGVGQLPTSALDLSSGPPQHPATTRGVTGARLVCPGPETLDAGSSHDRAPAASVVTVSSAAGDATSLTAVTVPVKGKAATLFAGPTTTGSLTSAASVEVRAAGTTAPGLAATQLTSVPSGDLRGLSTVACASPSTDAWLVGGGGQPGRRGRIVLTNVAANAVDVTLRVLSADGPVDSTAGADVTVPARGRTTVLLGALAPSVTSPVVHVSTSGGAVAATLHDAWLHGTTAWGTDDVAAGTPPSRSVLVPGVAVDGDALVRIAVPGQDEAVAQVRLLGPDGEVVAPQNGVVRVPGGSARDLDLGDLPPGTYGVEVTADVPVVAGAMVERRKDATGVGDLAWIASVPALTDGEHVLTAAPVGQQGMTATLAITAPEEDASLQLTTGTSAATPVRVRGGTTAVVDVPADQPVVLRAAGGSGPVAASRVLTTATPQGDLISTSSLRPSALVQHLTPLVPAS